VFTLLEILSYPTFYDSDHKKFVDLVSDNRIVVATYVQLARDIARIGAYAGNIVRITNHGFQLVPQLLELVDSNRASHLVTMRASLGV
jgi:phosphate uptake regulator